MKKAIYFLSAILMVLFLAPSASAQFEGKIMFKSYDYSSDGSPEEQDQFSMYITQDRILLQGEKEYKIMGSINTEGVLVRLDFEDFVFLTGDKQALKISKSDITSMMNMFGGGDVQNDDGDIEYERTNESQTIKGYKCEKFIFHDKDEADQSTVVWMTKDIQVNWGMLAEKWDNNADDMITNGFPVDIVFKEKYFPLKVEDYKNDQLVSMLEASEVTKSSIARAMVQVPSGVKVLSFQDYLFQKMSNQ